VDIAERHSAAKMGEFIASRIAVAGTTREFQLAPAEIG
jgi:hypothetical protein